MYNSRKKSQAAALRMQERREREDAAPRLHDELPKVKELKLAIAEHSSTGAMKHTKVIVINNAPALFVIPCGDNRCEDGGHDITADVMRALKAGATVAEGESSCSGTTGSSPCQRQISFTVTAEYAS